MMFNVNSRLTALVFCAFLVFGAGSSQAQNISADPVTDVIAETLTETQEAADEAPVLIELFSTQACLFCPQAERLFADLVTQSNIIGLSCHVDYFDVKLGNFSHDFCTARQKNYAEYLKSGPQYTPQMVVDGRVDVIGYKMDAIKEAMARVTGEAPVLFDIETSEDGAAFAAILPDIGARDDVLDLWLAIYDMPHEITVAEGRNRGKKMTFYNIVSDLRNIGAWDGVSRPQIIHADLANAQRGLVLLAQDRKTGAVLALGRYKKAE